MTKSFDEFDVYQKAVVLTKQIFKLVNDSRFDREFAFKDQIKRAAISISNNIAEGSEYNNNKDFVRFLKYSKGSCAEVRSMLIVSKELGFCEENEIEESIKLSVEISQNLSKFIDYLKLKTKV